MYRILNCTNCKHLCGWPSSFTQAIWSAYFTNTLHWRPHRISIDFFHGKICENLKIRRFVNSKQTKSWNLCLFRMAVTKQLNFVRIMYFWSSYWVQQHWSHFVEFLLNDCHSYTRNNYSWNRHSTDYILLFLWMKKLLPCFTFLVFFSLLRFAFLSKAGKTRDTTLIQTALRHSIR